MMAVVQSFTNDDDELCTRLIDDNGRITTWGPQGMLCRNACGREAAFGTTGLCKECWGQELDVEGKHGTMTM